MDNLMDAGCAAGFHNPTKWDCECTQWGGGPCCKQSSKTAICRLCEKLLDESDLNFIKKRDVIKNAIYCFRAKIKAQAKEATDAMDFMGIPLDEHDCLPDGTTICCRLARMAKTNV